MNNPAQVAGDTTVSQALQTHHVLKLRGDRRKKDPIQAAGLLLPTALALGVVVVFPLLQAVVSSLYSDSISGASTFIGFGNYAKALWGRDAPDFWSSVGITLFFTVICGLLELIIGTMMALLMNSVGRGRGLVRAFILIPWAIPTAIATVLWQWMLQPDGIVNHILGTHIIWTAGDVASKASIIIIDVWKTSPFIALLVLAGLQVIPGEIYEAARVDGASAWQRFWRITLPLARPAIFVAVLFRALDLMRMYDVPAILTHGANNTAPLSLFTFQNAISQVKVGYGSALSTLTFLAVFAVALVLIRALGSRNTDLDGD